MGFCNFATRKKSLTDAIDPNQSKLAKVLTTFDLTALGIGSTLGVGVYVLAGEVSKTTAGPGVVISFAIAAIASVFAGLCYAEFGARVPKAGSAYIYSYVTIGEFVAFLIGWNLILEYAIGAASVVKGLSTYLDALINNQMSDAFKQILPMNAPALGDYVDFFAFGMTMLFALGIAMGAKESTAINNVFTMINISVVLYVIVAGSFKVQTSNWSIPAEEVPPPDDDHDYGNGGFAPYGFAGIIKGAAICFYGFIGFDCIATASEEAENPKRSIPLSIIISLTVIFVAYFLISLVLTMMLPYFDQNAQAPLPHVFDYYGWDTARWIVSVGAMFGLCASLMGSMFPLPRVIYAMSIDGLMYEFMGRLSPRFKTPMYGTLLAGFLTGTIAAIFNLDQLVSMMSIGTLLAYSMVAGCVLILRFDLDDHQEVPTTITMRTLFHQMIHAKEVKDSNNVSSFIATWGVLLYACLALVFSLLISLLGTSTWYAIVLLFIAGFLLVATLFIISIQPRSRRTLSFTVPLVPWLPGLSILINIYLMTQLDLMTWVRFIGWIVIGLVIYFTYSIFHSKLRKLPVSARRSQITDSSETVDSFVEHKYTK